ncbi:hypothetical protein ACQ4M3_00540 [Leptolyngbya sp. AN03gr2]|uniref:hypothetical protein n=1 Tax=unclassified Leptolyngbya TaxID=2650499 RepID=UPI003D312548
MSRLLLGGSAVVSIASLGVYALSQNPLSSKAIPPNREKLFQDQLNEAQALNRKNLPLDAIKNTIGVPSNSKHFKSAQVLQESLSQQILAQAKEKYRRGNIKEALTALQVIPAATTAASESQQLRRTWTTEEQQLQAIQHFASQGNWNQAMQDLEKLRSSEVFNTPPVQALLQQAIAQTGETPNSLIATTSPAPLPITLSQAPTLDAVPPPPPPENATAVNVDRTLASTAERLDGSVPVAPLDPPVSIPIAPPDPPVSIARVLPPLPPSIVAAAPTSSSIQAVASKSPRSEPQFDQASVNSVPISTVPDPMRTATYTQPPHVSNHWQPHDRSIADLPRPTADTASKPPVQRELPPTPTTVTVSTRPNHSQASSEVAATAKAPRLNEAPSPITAPVVDRSNMTTLVKYETVPLPAASVEEMLSASTFKSSQHPARQTSGSRLLIEMQRKLTENNTTATLSIKPLIPPTTAKIPEQVTDLAEPKPRLHSEELNNSI